MKVRHISKPSDRAIKSLRGNEAYWMMVATERSRLIAGLKEVELLTDRLDKGTEGAKRITDKHRTNRWRKLRKPRQITSGSWLWGAIQMEEQWIKKLLADKLK